MRTNPSISFTLPRRPFLYVVATALLAASLAPAQMNSSLPRAEAMLVLPDSPGTLSTNTLTSIQPDAAENSSSSLDSSLAEDGTPARFTPRFDASFQTAPTGVGVMAGHLDKYIEPGERVPQLRIGDKILLGIKDAASPLSAVGWVTAAGYSHLVNGSPNYGTNGKAYLQRLGAAAARGSSQGIFSDSIMASVLHEDPRYYKMGKGHNVLKRAAYAATRTLITRTDGGHTTINFAYLSGNLAGAALTQAYYPPVNRGFSQVLQTFGGSIGGGAIGFAASEFIGDILHAIHHK